MTPERIAEAEACYQSILVARGSKRLSMLVLIMRNDRLPWLEVHQALKAAQEEPSPR